MKMKNIHRQLFAIIAIAILLTTTQIGCVTAKASDLKIESSYIYRNTFCRDAGILQVMLNRLLGVNEIVDGSINDTTVKNLVEFQKKCGVNVSWEVNQQVIDLLNRKYAEVENQPKVIVNIEKEFIELREGPNYGYSSTGTIKNGDVCNVLATSCETGWAKVEANGKIGWIEANKVATTFIQIDIEKQTVLFVIDTQEIVYTPVITGCEFDGNSTPKGVYRIVRMDEDCIIVGDTQVSFWDVICVDNGVFGIHDATWRAKFGGTIYKSNGSHGCINTPYEAAKIVHENLEVELLTVIL